MVRRSARYCVPMHQAQRVIIQARPNSKMELCIWLQTPSPEMIGESTYKDAKIIVANHWIDDLILNYLVSRFIWPFLLLV